MMYQKPFETVYWQRRAIESAFAVLFVGASFLYQHWTQTLALFNLALGLSIGLVALRGLHLIIPASMSILLLAPLLDLSAWDILNDWRDFITYFLAIWLGLYYWVGPLSPCVEGVKILKAAIWIILVTGTLAQLPTQNWVVAGAAASGVVMLLPTILIWDGYIPLGRTRLQQACLGIEAVLTLLYVLLGTLHVIPLEPMLLGLVSCGIYFALRYGLYGATAMQAVTLCYLSANTQQLWLLSAFDWASWAIVAVSCIWIGLGWCRTRYWLSRNPWVA